MVNELPCSFSLSRSHLHIRRRTPKPCVSWRPFGLLGVVFELGAGAFDLHRFPVRPWSLGEMLLPDIQLAALLHHDDLALTPAASGKYSLHALA